MHSILSVFTFLTYLSVYSHIYTFIFFLYTDAEKADGDLPT